jgi:YjbE family integral membrane protein
MPFYAFDPVFWVSVGQIMLVNIILSGDNAVVIALAARSLPESQKKQAVVWGSVAAILMRVALTIVALTILKVPFLKLVGSFLLFWIALKLLTPEKEAGIDGIKEQDNLSAAIRTILIADLVMSLDNVLAVAAAAKGDNVLLMLGLGVSIPLVIFGSTIILRMMDRFPMIVTLGAALLGYVAGDMFITDPALDGMAISQPDSWAQQALPYATGLLVVLIGKWLSRRQQSDHRELLDLVRDDEQPK